MASKDVFPVMADPLIAVVCDIRGFTHFTAMVDSVNKSDQVKQATKSALLRDYNNLVVDTQRDAVRLLLSPFVDAVKMGGVLRNMLEKELEQATVPPVPCALKSTGDGFLLALPLYGPDDQVPYNLEIQAAIADLATEGASKLVESGKHQHVAGTIRNRLGVFFDRWRDYFAVDFESDAHSYRIASAVAVGTGSIVRAKMSSESEIFKYVKSNVDSDGTLELRDDAYGHGVNLAFRLCDRSGRPPQDLATSTGTEPPYIYLCRRTGQLLVRPQRDVDDNFIYRMGCLPDLRLTQIRFDAPLKGIDELWCYGLANIKTAA